MTGTGKEGEEVADEGAVDRDLIRMTAEKLLCHLDEEVQTSCCLHTGDRRDHCGDHKHYINRRRGGHQTKSEDQYRQSYTSCHTEADTTETGTDDDGYQDEKQLDK